MVYEIILWLAVYSIVHSYVLFPLFIKIVSSFKKEGFIAYKESDDLPDISVLIAAYNEEKVIGEKIKSIFTSAYPNEKIEVIIGSDGSDDGTNEIISELTREYKGLKLVEFQGRSGKPNVINQLVQRANSGILILSDANVLFSQNTIRQLIKYFKDPSVGLVDSNMNNIGLRKEGISEQESAYVNREVSIKHHESKLWGTMMGPFGGCFAIRKELYTPVPSNYLVDDFYICMQVLKKNKKAINSLEAVVYEDVSSSIKEEFRRKIRIATGNFQNLRSFAGLLFSRRPGLSISFFSHKVLRWFGPLFIIIALVMNILLYNENLFYKYLLYLQLAMVCVPLLDLLLRGLKINNMLVRLVSHFYSMNFALFIGLLKFMRGVKTNVWQPTKRLQ